MNTPSPLESDLPNYPNFRFSSRPKCPVWGTWCALLISCATLSNASERVAFVVGNDTYAHGTPLKNAVADSRLVGKALQECGFKVIALENAGIEKFYEGLEEFKREAVSANVGLVYFAGHGIEVDGDNYLLPVDANLESRSQLRFQTVSLEMVLQDMEESDLPVKLAVLDCCRDNPLKRSWIVSRSGTRGGLGALRDESLPEVSMIMYSARPGEVAYDGEGENSPFSLALAARLVKPGQSVFEAFYKTADDVMEATGSRQEPWVKADGSAQAIRRLVLMPGGTPANTPPSPAPGELVQAENAIPASVPASMLEIGNTAPNPAGAPLAAVGSSAAPEEATPLPFYGPPAIPQRGYFSNEELFADSPYAKYNDYSLSEILRSAQAKLPDAGSADGQMGRKTQAAILLYQAAADLPLTGRLDACTLAKMELVGIAEKQQTASKSGKSGSKRSYGKSSGRSYRSGGGSLEGRAAAAAARAVLGF